jgi:hypothetical protein
MKIRFFLISLVVLPVILGTGLSSGSFSQDITDDEIKAALIFKFPVYVDWPDEALNKQSKVFNCCVLGNDHLSRLLDHFDGEKIDEKTVRVKKISEIGEIESCHLLFVSSTKKKQLPKILKAIQGKHILTISDMEGFARNGGVINFIRQKDSVHFVINPDAGKRAGLKISSKLLRLAKIVGGK